MSATLTNGTARQAALIECQERLTAGSPISGAELADRFGKSSSWGRSVVAEARRTTAPGGPPTAPDTPVTTDVEPLPDRGEDVSPWVGWVTVLAVLAVALAAAVASVEHLAVLARIAGDTGLKAWLLPVSVDGLVVAASMVCYTASRTGRRPGALPVAALTLGLSASVTGNVLAVQPDLVDPTGLRVAVAAWPPLALALAFDMALRQVRAGSKGQGQ